jgi:predicted GH43/DUF377 family glycosyl hydrolase
LLLLATLVPSACIASRGPVAATGAWGIGPFTKVDSANPVLSPGSSVFRCPMTGRATAWEKDNVFNPAAVVRGNKVYLLYRAEDDSGAGIGLHTSRIGLAASSDGKSFRKRSSPVLFPTNDNQKAFDWPGGCEDPRVVEAPDGGYVLTYTAWNRKTATLSVATSRDLVHWHKHGPAFAKAGGGRWVKDWSKSASIVCRLTGDHLVAARIAGKYWMYWGEGQIRAATSTNLIDWTPVTDTKGRYVALMDRRPGKWDSDLVECGPPAVITHAGIVLLFNGKNAAQNGDPAVRPGTYSAGQALFSAANPTHLIERRDAYFLTPEKPYETTGQYTAGTVFIEGLIHFNHRWCLYYGTADSHVALARTEPAK